MLRALIFLLCITVHLSGETNKGEKYQGWFPWNHKNHVKMVSRFLPYNSKGLLISRPGSQLFGECLEAFPRSTLQTIPPTTHLKESLLVNYLLLDCENFELTWLKKSLKHLPQLQSIYIKSKNFRTLRHFFATIGFTPAAHWQGESDEALFVHRDIHEAYVNILNYSKNATYTPPMYTPHADLEQYLKPAINKGNTHSFHSIDFIYMINLDERPEKFTIATTGLNKHGIYPYRFSAVNGWKLPFEALNAVGLRFNQGLPKEKYLGLVYRSDDTSTYNSYETIQDSNLTYFSSGMTLGSIGIVLSHVSVLADAYKSGYNTIWVMEDDVKVIQDPLLIPDLMKQLDEIDPAWDIFFTDIDTRNQEGILVPCRAIAIRPNYPVESVQTIMERFYPVTKDINRIGMRYGAYSMIIRKSGIEKILKFYKTYSIFIPYDTDFWLIPDLKMYSANFDIISTIPNALTDNGKPNYKKSF